MLKLSDDALISVLLFLSPAEVSHLALVSKRLLSFVSDDPNYNLWTSICSLFPLNLYRQLKNSHLTSELTDKQVARLMQGSHNISVLDWARCRYEDGATAKIDSQEAHAACTILDRFMIVVGGWGPGRANEVSVLDGGRSAEEDTTLLRPVHVENTNVGRFRYGMSVVTVKHEVKWRLLVFGGLTMGGYAGDCADMYYVDLTFTLNNMQEGVNATDAEIFAAPREAIMLVSAAHRRVPPVIQPQAAGGSSSSSSFSSDAVIPPSTRGYHTANVVNVGGRQCMLVFGGLHQRGPTNSLQVYDIDSNTWRAAAATGTAPSKRFGHTCTAVNPTGFMRATPTVLKDWRGKIYDDSLVRLIYCGGSDGSDLWRNGRDLRDIHVLTVDNRIKGKPPTLTWSSPILSSVQGINIVPGRCHSANLVGSKIICFGGGAEHTSEIVVIDLLPKKEPEEEWGIDQRQHRSGTRQELSAALASRPEALHFHLYSPFIDRRGEGKECPRPRQRLSHVSFSIGHHLFIQGGFSRHFRELGDLWRLD